MRITVTVPELIDRLQAYKRRQLATYEEHVQRYPEELALYRDRVTAALERELANVRKGRKLPGSYSSYSRDRSTGGVIVKVGAMPPTKPQRPTFEAVNRRIKELRLSAKPEISIDTTGNDWRGLFSAIERP